MPHTPEQKREYNRRPEVFARQKMLRKQRQSTQEYKAKRREYLAQPEIRLRESLRSRTRYTTPEAKLHLRERRLRRKRFLLAKESKRTYCQKLKCMMEADWVEWILSVSIVTGHSPYGIIRMNRLLQGCV